MRKYLTLAAVAPLALLAACGDSDTETTTMDDDMVATDTGMDDTAMADGNADASTMAPGTASTFADAGDYSGEYSYSADDGTTRNLTLNSADNTYQYTGTDGTVQRGSYEPMSDGYRIRIADYYGSPAWFGYSNGSLVQLEDDVEITADTDFSPQSSEYGSRPVFSRSPQIGSTVAPDNM